MSDLNKFQSYLKNTAELFEYQFQINVFADGGTFDPNLTVLKDLTLFANTTTLPGKSLERADVFHFGFNFKKPSRVIYTDSIAIDIRMDADLKIHKALSDWMDSFYSLDAGGGGDRTLPQYNLKLYVLDKNLNVVEGSKTIVLAGAYPSNIGDVNMTHESSGVAIVSTEFTYNYWYYDNNDPLG